MAETQGVLNSTTIWIAFACYMVFLMAIAIYVTRSEKKKKETGNLLTASVPWPVLVMTYIASLMSTWVFFAGPGAYYRGGLGYWISEISYIALFPIIAHFTMNKVWMINQAKGGTFETPADFYDQRFKSKPLRVVLGVIFLISSFPYIASVLVAIAQAAEYATGGKINYVVAVIVVGLIMTIFVCIGGVKSAALADTVQGLAFIVLLWAIVILALVKGFGGSLGDAVKVLWEKNQAFFSYPGPDSWVSYGARFGYPFSCAIGWTIMLPHVFVRSGYFGNNMKTQRTLSFLTHILQAIVWTGTMLIGLVGLTLVTTGIMNADGMNPELIIPSIIEQVINGKSHGLATFMMIAFFIGATAVGLSTSNAFLSVSSSIVSKDFLQETFKVKISEKAAPLVQRVIILCLGIGSMLLAIKPPDLIFTLIMFAIAIVMPLFPVLVLGIYWKKATKQAAVISSIVGAVVVLMTYFWWNLGGTWYGAFGLIASTVLMIVISLVTHQDPKDSEEFYELLDKGEKMFFRRPSKKVRA